MKADTLEDLPVHSAPRLQRPEFSQSSKASFRLGLVSDFLEEEWPSMDLISEMFFQNLQKRREEGIDVEQIRPSFYRTVSRYSRSSAARNLDRLLNRHVGYPRHLSRLPSRFDVFHIVDHSYAHLAKFIPEERTVVTCHDLDAFRCILEPEKEPRPAWFRMMMNRALEGLRAARHVTFVTEAVRKRATSCGLVDANRSSVVSMGVHPSCSAESDLAADAAAERMLRVGPPGPLLLHVGSTIQRKRIDILLHVFASVRATVPSARLVRVGGPFTPAQEHLAQELRISDDVIHMPFLDRNVLAAVYRRAHVLLQTSDNEGFGLPLVEAMACGCPVIASDIDVLREVGGSVTQFCRVGDVDQWSDTVLQSLRRQTHKNALIAHAAQFTWAKSTGQMIGLYRAIAANS